MHALSTRSPPALPRPVRSRFPTLYQPWAVEKAKTLSDKDDPALHCVPVAFGTVNVSLYGLGFVGQIVQTPNLVVMLTETYHSFKVIPVDGRPHRDDVAPSFRGDSVGRWDGDTLVVSSSGFNDLGWLDVDGNPQTESLTLTERFTRKDFGHLGLDVTFADPKVFAKPFTLHMDKTLAADTEILEDVCENEKSGAHLTSGVSLPPDVLAKYAGTYDLAGRRLVVSVSGEQLVVDDPANPLDRLFVARSESAFSSSVSQVAVEFVSDASGKVTHFTRTIGARSERAVRK